MDIKSITVWTTALTSHTPYYMAEGKACESVATVIVRITDATGTTGWGEVCPIPHYLPAYADGVLPAITEMARPLLGEPVSSPDAAMARLDAWLPGHVYAKSAIDIALWDLFARKLNVPLHALLGGKRAVRMPLYHSITCIAPDDMARIAREAYSSGIRQFQAKLGADRNWEADVARLRLVREAVGNGPIVYGDWNCGANRLDAIRVGRAVQDLDVMLEQPCATLEDCAAVKRATGLPMKLDELAHDTTSLLKAWHLDCMDAVALKLSKFGGLTPLRRARDLCLHLGPKLCIECTWGSDIAMAAALHLGAATPPESVLNVCDLAGYVSPQLSKHAPRRQDGFIKPPEGPGLGVAPDLSILGEPVANFE
ncbi:MAG: enolase C-terminal domain-like protein [Pseudomonadota bacterium]